MALFGTGINRSHVVTAPHLFNSVPTICNVVWKHLNHRCCLFPYLWNMSCPCVGLGKQNVAEVSLCQLWACSFFALLKQSPFEQSWERWETSWSRDKLSWWMPLSGQPAITQLTQQLPQTHEETHLRPAQMLNHKIMGFALSYHI